MDPSPPGWAHRPPSPPSHSSVPADPSIRMSALKLGLGAPLRMGNSPIPLPTPVSTTAHPSPSPVAIPTNVGAVGLMSPPTPAPSPTPRNKSWGFGARSETERSVVEPGTSAEDDMSMMVDDDLFDMPGEGSPWKGKRKVFRQHDGPAELLNQFQQFTQAERFAFLASLVPGLRLNEALVVSRNIAPRLKRDFLRELPMEIALHILSFVDDPATLGRAACVSRFWYELLEDERTWKDMCERHSFTAIRSPITYPRPPRQQSGFGIATPGMRAHGPLRDPREFRKHSRPMSKPVPPPVPIIEVTFKQQYKRAYQTESNWLHGGRLIAIHNSHDDGVVTSLAVDENFIVVGMANARIHVFDLSTGAFRRTLVGHEVGVWALVLVTPTPSSNHHPPTVDTKPSFSRLPKASQTYRDGGQSRRNSFTASTSDPLGRTGAPTEATSSGYLPRPNTALGLGGVGSGPEGRDPKGKTRKPGPSDPCGAARGWGNRRPLVVSGGCDRTVRVWDVITGQCIHVLQAHVSTIRCLKVLDGRPIAVSGSRDGSLRVWDIERGRLVNTLEGHLQSVRCIDVSGNRVVSGSYDYTCRVWDVDTAECIHVLRGHYHQVYGVAFDGEIIVSGSLDSTVRVWSAETGACLAMLQGHTSLVGQLQLSSSRLITGGSDGRVIIFDLATASCLHRLCAHDNSVTCLQFDDRFIVSGGNDGRVKLWDVRTGMFIRELTRPCDAVWRVSFKDDKCVILCQREGRTVLEILTFRPGEEWGRKVAV